LITAQELQRQKPTFGYTRQNDKDVPIRTDLFIKLIEDIL